MILKTNNLGTFWVFSDAECSDYAYICTCMPSDRMTRREVDFIRKMESRFRGGIGGNLTERQWEWFVEIGEKYSSFIQGQEHAVEDIRALVAQIGHGHSD